MFFGHSKKQSIWNYLQRCPVGSIRPFHKSLNVAQKNFHLNLCWQAGL
jgi:hypothetical protein